MLLTEGGVGGVYGVLGGLGRRLGLTIRSIGRFDGSPHGLLGTFASL